jgi:hypothetical protein
LDFVIFRSENSQLEKFREKIRKQHEILTRENEKLARKLEQVLRSQGHQPSNVITQHPAEYIILEDTPPSPSVDHNLNKSHTSKTLPRIDKLNGESVTIHNLIFCMKKLIFNFLYLKEFCSFKQSNARQS